MLNSSTMLERLEKFQGLSVTQYALLAVVGFVVLGMSFVVVVVVLTLLLGLLALFAGSSGLVLLSVF